MPGWRAQQYLLFERERTRPCRDLVNRISLEQAAAIIDLGCGPGNSTAVLAARWPQARIIGLDSSMAMLDAARQSFPQYEWIEGEIAQWAESSKSSFDVVFSNAAMQWVEDHASVYPRLFARVRPRGVLAIQVPANLDSPAHRIMREIASSAVWRNRFNASSVRQWYVHEAEFYYDVLAANAANVDLWTTEYIQVMPDAESIAEWYKGSGLRPFLDALSDGHYGHQFMNEYTVELRRIYKAQPDGRVLFPFRRLFLIAS